MAFLPARLVAPFCLGRRQWPKSFVRPDAPRWLQRPASEGRAADRHRGRVLPAILTCWCRATRQTDPRVASRRVATEEVDVACPVHWLPLSLQRTVPVSLFG